ncbi:hypothetical protein RUND412_006264 [Rhizina undulata]
MSSDTPADDSIDTQKQLQYWNSVEATDNGMLGGYSQISRIDLVGSKTFLAKLKLPTPPSPRRIVDCGAGIGRITKGLLTKLGENTIVDIVEPVKKFTDEITGGDEFKAERGMGRIGEVFNVGIEEWVPETGRYWIIWTQWCVGHLTDKALVEYLRRCATGLIPGGVILVKENLTGGEEDIFDEVDSSVTRSDTKFRALFKEANLKIIRTELQKGLPSHLGLYPIRIYALRPF